MHWEFYGSENAVSSWVINNRLSLSLRSKLRHFLLADFSLRRRTFKVNEIMEENEAKEDKRKSFTMLNHCVHFILAFVFAKFTLLCERAEIPWNTMFMFIEATKEISRWFFHWELLDCSTFEHDKSFWKNAFYEFSSRFTKKLFETSWIFSEIPSFKRAL
jgi:hypothetical protein